MFYCPYYSYIYNKNLIGPYVNSTKESKYPDEFEADPVDEITESSDAALTSIEPNGGAAPGGFRYSAPGTAPMANVTAGTESCPPITRQCMIDILKGQIRVYGRMVTNLVPEATANALIESIVDFILVNRNMLADITDLDSAASALYQKYEMEHPEMVRSIVSNRVPIAMARTIVKDAISILLYKIV